MSGITSRNLYKLFVGNLPWTIGHTELQAYFSKFGHVTSANVIFEKAQGLSKGYGFVTFATREAFTSARDQDNHFLEGRILTVSEANS